MLYENSRLIIYKYYFIITYIQITIHVYFLTETLKRQLKNTYRAYKVGVNKATAYNFFDIDALLPLQIFELLATYTFVVLAYNFLPN